MLMDPLVFADDDSRNREAASSPACFRADSAEQMIGSTGKHAPPVTSATCSVCQQQLPPAIRHRLLTEIGWRAGLVHLGGSLLQ